MEWFKHDTDASTDAKIRKLIMRHGAVGYAVYFHCLELIMADVNKNNITFQLEHDAEIIADNLKINGNGMEAGVDIVNKIMITIIDLKLFESNSNRITCVKLLSRLDSSMTSNTDFRKALKATKTTLLAPSHDTIMTPSCLNHDTIMQEQEREAEQDNNKNLEKEKEIEIDYKEKNTKKKIQYQEYPTKPKYEDMPEPEQPKLSQMITAGIKHWNSKENLPACKYTVITLPNNKLPEITNKFDVFRDGEILNAIDNLSKAYDSIDQDYRPKNFQNFIVNSLDNWFEEREDNTPKTYRTEEERKYYACLEMYNNKPDPDNEDDLWIAERKQQMEESLNVQSK